MNMISKIESFACAALTLSGALLLAEPASATTSDFYPAYLQAKVVAHLPLSGGVRRRPPLSSSLGGRDRPGLDNLAKGEAANPQST